MDLNAGFFLMVSARKKCAFASQCPRTRTRGCPHTELGGAGGLGLGSTATRDNEVETCVGQSGPTEASGCNFSAFILELFLNISADVSQVLSVFCNLYGLVMFSVMWLAPV